MISAIRAQKRARMIGSAMVMTPWEVLVSDYRSHDGMRVPFSGEVAWLTPEGRLPYWRGTIATLRYEFAGLAERKEQKYGPEKRHHSSECRHDSQHHLG